MMHMMNGWLAGSTQYASFFCWEMAQDWIQGTSIWVVQCMNYNIASYFFAKEMTLIAHIEVLAYVSYMLWANICYMYKLLYTNVAQTVWKVWGILLAYHNIYTHTHCWMTGNKMIPPWHRNAFCITCFLCYTFWNKDYFNLWYAIHFCSIWKTSLKFVLIYVQYQKGNGQFPKVFLLTKTFNINCPWWHHSLSY